MRGRESSPPVPAAPIPFRIGAIDDAAEREADAMADRMLRRKCSACEDEERLSRSATGGAVSAEAPTAVGTVLRQAGQRLRGADASFFSSALGSSVEGVRIHDGSAADRAARSVGARAFALGHDVVFARGEYRPHTAGGRRLLAHELAHVAQADGVLRRAVPKGAKLVEEAAGGCGICMPPSEAGNIAHRMIQTEFMLEFEIDPANRTPRFVEVVTPCSSGKGTRRPDLAEVRGKGKQRIAYLGSIKPAAQGYYDSSEAEFNKNKACVKKVDPNLPVQPLQVPMPGVAVKFASALGKALEGMRGTGCKLQDLKVNPPDEFGLYTYFCKPTRREVLADPNCRCGKGRVPPFVERVREPAKEGKPTKDAKRQVEEPAPETPVTAPQPTFRLELEGVVHDALDKAAALKLLAEAGDRLAKLIDLMEGEHQLYAKEKAAASVIGFAGFVTEWANDVKFPWPSIWTNATSEVNAMRRALKAGDLAAALAAYNAARLAAGEAQGKLDAYKTARDLGGERMMHRQIPAAAALVALTVVAAPAVIQGMPATLPGLYGSGAATGAAEGAALLPVLVP